MGKKQKKLHNLKKNLYLCHKNRLVSQHQIKQLTLLTPSLKNL